MKPFRPYLVLLALVSLVLAGCGGTRPTGISVSLVNFRPTDSTLLESRGVLTVRYTNENISPLGYSGSTHKVFLNGTYVGKAVSDQPFGVPPLNTVTQDIPIQFENLALVQQLLTMRDRTTVAYRLESVLFQTVYEDKYQVKLKAEGALDLSAIATAVK